jgi:hypothetical protein
MSVFFYHTNKLVTSVSYSFVKYSSASIYWCEIIESSSEIYVLKITSPQKSIIEWGEWYIGWLVIVPSNKKYKLFQTWLKYPIQWLQSF